MLISLKRECVRRLCPILIFGALPLTFNNYTSINLNQSDHQTFSLFTLLSLLVFETSTNENYKQKSFFLHIVIRIKVKRHDKNQVADVIFIVLLNLVREQYGVNNKWYYNID